MIIELIEEARASGARLDRCCEIVGIDTRTVQRWLAQEPDGGQDQRKGPNTPPINKLSDEERRRALKLVNSPEFVDLSPRQIVPKLADQGIYIASESTIYRLLEQESLNAHRGRTRAPTHRRPDEHVATGPEQVLCWDITYLPTTIKGKFYYLYLFLDVWSRKIMGWDILGHESTDEAARIFCELCEKHGINPKGLVLHADNGGPMKGATLLATLQMLAVVTSFSRPGVSDDNPFVESFFRTAKYHPSYPPPFSSLDEARAWFTEFAHWYNEEHQHSGIRFVTPSQRHAGIDIDILRRRSYVYEEAKALHPERWSGDIRNWARIDIVSLNGRPSPARDAKRTSQM